MFNIVTKRLKRHGRKARAAVAVAVCVGALGIGVGSGTLLAQLGGGNPTPQTESGLPCCATTNGCPQGCTNYGSLLGGSSEVTGVQCDTCGIGTAQPPAFCKAGPQVQCGWLQVYSFEGCHIDAGNPTAIFEPGCSVPSTPCS